MKWKNWYWFPVVALVLLCLPFPFMLFAGGLGWTWEWIALVEWVSLILGMILLYILSEKYEKKNPQYPQYKGGEKK